MTQTIDQLDAAAARAPEGPPDGVMRSDIARELKHAHENLRNVRHRFLAAAPHLIAMLEGEERYRYRYHLDRALYYLGLTERKLDALPDCAWTWDIDLSPDPVGSTESGYSAR
jgi:hypothetical protein